MNITRELIDGVANHNTVLNDIESRLSSMIEAAEILGNEILAERLGHLHDELAATQLKLNQAYGTIFK